LLDGNNVKCGHERYTVSSSRLSLRDRHHLNPRHLRFYPTLQDLNQVNPRVVSSVTVARRLYPHNPVLYVNKLNISSSRTIFLSYFINYFLDFLYVLFYIFHEKFFVIFYQIGAVFDILEVIQARKTSKYILAEALLEKILGSGMTLN